MEINVNKLPQEIENAGIPNSGCNEKGVVWDTDGTTEIQDQPAVAAIILAHDPTDYIQQRQDKAEASAKDIPGWASWTADQVLEWIDTNLTAEVGPNLLVFCKAIALLILALRDKVFPGLPGLGPD